MHVLFLNALSVNGAIMAAAPLLARPAARRINLPAGQYGLAFGVPALGGRQRGCPPRHPLLLPVPSPVTQGCSRRW
ncbi:hypothetical protein Ate01nite_56230 [Actinoplanes teichomyceticus]|nr:hypothetical protein Ate01nite_56230 [Actinoplanes teichomyceticus]